MWPIAIAGHLKQRLESPALVAARLSVCLARLADLDPLFTGWVRGGMRHRSAVPRVITLPPDEVELRTWIVENAISSREKDANNTLAIRSMRGPRTVTQSAPIFG